MRVPRKNAGTKEILNKINLTFLVPAYSGTRKKVNFVPAFFVPAFFKKVAPKCVRLKIRYVFNSM